MSKIIIVPEKTYDQAKPGEHPAVCANAVFQAAADAKYRKDHFTLTYYIGDQTTTTGRPVRIYKDLNLEFGAEAHLPKYLDAMGLPPVALVARQHHVDVDAMIPGFIGANCRLIIITGKNEKGQPKSKIVDILPPLPGSPKLIIPPQFVLYGRTDSQSSGFFQESATPISSPVQTTTASRWGSAEEMMAAAGVEKTSTPADLSVNIASVMTKIRKKPGHDSFTTGTVEEGNDRPLQ